MKKKLVAALAAMMAATLLATGCATNKASNEYVTVEGYKGIEIEKVEAIEVTDADVEEDIQSTLENNAETAEITDGSAAKEGDIATINYVGKKDGVEFEGGTGNDYPLELGSGSFIDGFEDGVIGHKTGETFDLNLTFPEDYGNTELAGQAVVFTVTINKLEEQKLPELNDEFVQTVSETSKTVDEYKKEVKKALEESNKSTAEQNLKEAVWNAVVESAEVSKYPKDKVKEYKELIQSTYEQYATIYGMDLETFIQEQLGTDMEGYEKQLDEAAKDSAKQDEIINAIAKKEKLELSEKELNKKYKEYKEMYGYESVKAMKESVGEDALKETATKEAVLDWLVDNCKQIEKSDSDKDK